MIKTSTLKGYHVAAIIAASHTVASLAVLFAHSTNDRLVRHGDLSFLGLLVDVIVGSAPILTWIWMEIDATRFEEQWAR